MSDMFDHALDALESQIEYDMWGMRSPKYKTLNEMCRFCGEMKVMWRKEARRLFATGKYNCKQLGKMFGLSQSGMYAVVHRKWGNL